MGMLIGQPNRGQMGNNQMMGLPQMYNMGMNMGGNAGGQGRRRGGGI